MNIEIASPVKGISNKDILISMNTGDAKMFPIGKRGTVSPIISSDIKIMYPDRLYETDGKSEKGILIVKRIK